MDEDTIKSNSHKTELQGLASCGFQKSIKAGTLKSVCITTAVRVGNIAPVGLMIRKGYLLTCSSAKQINTCEGQEEMSKS